MRFVVKLGGSALEDHNLLHGCARAIAVLAQDGNQVAVVHGGGAALTRTLKQMGKQSEFIAGLRITDAETRDAALMVLGGRVNKELVAAWAATARQALAFRWRWVDLSRAQEAHHAGPGLCGRDCRPRIRAGSMPSGRWARCR
jgi:acetylglutamate kinase